MITDRELWACANTLIAQHGDRVDAVIAERVAALAVAGDEAGVRTWRAIADRVDGLRCDAGRTRH